jgi:hypothetical protein
MPIISPGRGFREGFYIGQIRRKQCRAVFDKHVIAFLRIAQRAQCPARPWFWEYTMRDDKGEEFT